jgi:hypothetical protein
MSETFKRLPEVFVPAYEWPGKNAPIMKSKRSR